MKPSFTPPPLLFWTYVTLSALSAIVVELDDTGSLIRWALPIEIALLYGLYRGFAVAWWLLLIFGAWGVVVITALPAEGMGLEGSELAVVVIGLVQLALLLAIRVKAHFTPRPATGPGSRP